MRETDTVFLQTVGRFIQAQVQLAVIPLAQTIAEQATEISRLKEKQDKEFGQLSTAGNIVNHRLDKLYNATDDWERVARMIDQAIHDLPPPTNGKDGKDGAEGKQGPQGPAAKDGAPGRDAAELLNTVIDRNGHLIVTLSNGSTKDVGVVVGRDGKDGVGQPGKDGRDGFGFEDFGIEYDGEKTFTFYFVRGDEKKTFSFITPLIIYRGIWRQGKYLKGDAATYDGGMFVAKEDTETAPGITGSDWQLATKRGRDGKQGEKGDTGDGGKPGRDGRDLTQMGLDGSKW